MYELTKKEFLGEKGVQNEKELREAMYIVSYIKI